MRAWTKLLPCLVVAACTNFSTPFSGSGKSQGKDEKTPTEERPTEGAEGVPGYFAAPEKITAKTNGKVTTISGEAGAIVASTAVGPVRIDAFTALIEAVRSAAKAAGGSPVTARRLQTAFANADGSFELQVEALANELVLLSAASAQDPERLTMPGLDSKSQPSLVVTDLQSPFGFAAVYAGSAAAASGLSLRCALGPAKDGRMKLVAAPEAFADGQYCSCGTDALGDEHPLSGFFSGPGRACSQGEVPVAKRASMAATFVEFQPGVCSPVYFDCAMDPEISSETLNPGPRHRAASFFEAWKLAMQVCHTFTSNALTDPFKVADIDEKECVSVRQSVTVGSRTLKGCDLDMADNHPAVIARCLGDSLSTRQPCDYAFFYEDVCPSAGNIFLTK